MKSIVESLKGVLLEKYSSSIIEDLFAVIDPKSYEGHEFLRKYAWDKITDEDLEKISTQEARKIAYKRKESEWDNLILWIKNDKLLAWSIGTFMFHTIGDTKWRGIYSSVKAISEAADYAYLLKNQKEFETYELRRLRREAKENALALQDAEDVKNANIARYEKIIAKKSFDQSSPASEITNLLKDITEKYTNAILILCSPENSIDRKKVDIAIRLNNIYKDLMYEYNNVWSAISTSKNDDDYGYATAYYYKASLKDVETFKSTANKLEKYIQKI